jgi:hypothetical protein
VAEDGVRATGQHPRHPGPEARDVGPTNGVDPSVDRV